MHLYLPLAESSVTKSLIAGTGGLMGIGNGLAGWKSGY